MGERSNILKTCLICGNRKPLSAFLQISETKGSHYANICSSCREAIANKEFSRLEDSLTDEGVGAPDIQLANRAKIRALIKQKKENLAKDLEEKRLKREKEEREHAAFERKRTHKTRDAKRRKELLRAKEKAAKKFKKEQKKISKKHANLAIDIDRAEITHAFTIQAFRGQRLHFSVPFISSLLGEMNFWSPVTKMFRAWVGKSAPMQYQDYVSPELKTANHVANQTIKDAATATVNIKKEQAKKINLTKLFRAQKNTQQNKRKPPPKIMDYNKTT